MSFVTAILLFVAIYGAAMFAFMHFLRWLDRKVGWWQ